MEIENIFNNPELAKTMEQMASSHTIFLPEDPDEEAFITDDEAMDFAE